MGKRKHQILTDAERHFLIGIPDDRDELARRFTFESSDIDIIGAPRSHRNWLGLALQLALLRHPGMTLAQFVLDTGSVPSALTGFVAEQLGLPVAALADYAAREQTMTDHARKLAAKLGLRAPRRDDVPFMIEAGAKVAWGTDNGLNIAMGIVAAVRDAGILLPSIATIERAAIAGRARARKSAAHHLIEGLNDEQVLTLDQLFDEGEESGGATKLTWLKTLPVAAKADHVKGILDRLKVVRAIAIPADRAQRIHVERYRQYVREGRASPAYMVERYTVSRRQATLVACLIDLEERLTDAALDMADKLIGGIFTRARNAQARDYATTSKRVALLMRMFQHTIEALSDATETGEDPLELLDSSVGWHNLMQVWPEVQAIAKATNTDPLTIAADRYATLRKFMPDLLETLEFKAAKGSAKTIAALEVLKSLNKSGKRDLPDDAPMPFRKEWQKLVTGEDGKVNRRLWEMATIAHLRNKLRSGDVWVERSAAYRRFDSYLLSEPQSVPWIAELGLPDKAEDWLAERTRQLDWRLKKFAQRLKKGDLEGVQFDNDRLQISPVRATTTTEEESLADRIDSMMPHIRITELLHDVARETGFLRAFTNLRTGEPCPNENALLATILADATNLGLSRMAAASQGVTRDQLLWTHDAYIREDTYRAALATIINAHHALPFSQVWGDGSTSSSDGQFFRGAKRGTSGGDKNARYGVDYGFCFYTHVSDQRSPYHVQVISAATHEAPYVLDGLMHHGTDLKITEHYTDTGGATDHVFALFAMLGFRFCPRLRDFPDRRLVSVGAASNYPFIAPLLGKKLRTDVIREQWPDVLRLVSSIKAGHVAPSVMLRKLAAYERQNQLDIALQEIGKIERTLFMLDWLESAELRRRCHAGLNNSEQRHALTQAIYTFRQGRIVDRSHEAQQYRASGLNLVISAIIYWNTTYMGEAVQHMRAANEVVPDEHLAHTSPVGWEHIAFSGDFLWDSAAKSAGRKALNLRENTASAATF